MERTRAKVVARFAAAFGAAAPDAGVDPALVDTLARHLEICLWNWSIRTAQRDGIPLYWESPKFRYRYTTRALSLAFNLRHPRNPDLVRRLLRRELGLKDFASMRPSQMFPALWEPVYERVASAQLRREAGITRPEDAPDGAYTCRRCKSKKTTYMSIQIRSADEPMTQFVHCLQCGNAWKD